jgi:hypothetical protein
MKLATILFPLVLLGTALAWRHSDSARVVAPVAYPDGYRNWAHVKSTLIPPMHKNFASMGGYQHVYANADGMVGYRTRAFPEGAIVVVEWLEMRDVNGAYAEGPRRQLDVMVKDARRFAITGGWGFQRFAGDSKTELAATPTPQQCFTCHDSQRKDGLVLSTYRQ